MAKANLKAQLKQAADNFIAKLTPVELPGLGITVQVRPARVCDRKAYVKDGKALDDATINKYHLMQCLVDEDGTPVYDLNCPDDIAAVENLPSLDFDMILKAIGTASGFDALAKAAIEKN